MPAIPPDVLSQLFGCGDDISPPAQSVAPQGAVPLHLKSEIPTPPSAQPGPSSAPAPAVASAPKPKPKPKPQPVSESESEGDVSDPEQTLIREERLEKTMAKQRESFGYKSDATLTTTFKLLDCLIGQYKLNRTQEILLEIMPTCKELGGNWYVKAIQSLAFCRWKQYRFKEALELFLEQQELIGASAALCENIGHTYSSLHNLEKAEEYFENAIELLKRGSFGNKGGIYMGLGLVRDRLGKTEEALPILEQALEHYEKEHTNASYQQMDSSIIAKAHMSIGHAQEKMGRFEEAGKHMAEAVQIFKRTVGDSSPLTANALGSLGKVRTSQGRLVEALQLIKKALQLEIEKDAFHLETVWDLFNRLKDVNVTHMNKKKPDGQGGDGLKSVNVVYKPYMNMITQACQRISKKHRTSDAGTLSVFYKTTGELCLLAGEYVRAEGFLNEAIEIFETIPDFDCSSLIESSKVLLQIAEANKGKAKATVAAGSSSS